MAGVVVQIVGGLAVLVPCIIICRAYTKRTEAMAELIEALDRGHLDRSPAHRTTNIGGRTATMVAAHTVKTGRWAATRSSVPEPGRYG